MNNYFEEHENGQEKEIEGFIESRVIENDAYPKAGSAQVEYKAKKKSNIKAYVSLVLITSVLSSTAVGGALYSKFSSDLEKQAALIQKTSITSTIQNDRISTGNALQTALSKGSTVTQIAKKVGPSIVGIRMTVADIIKEYGIEIPPSMGISQAVNFQSEGQNAATTGDFVLIANEVNPVVRTLKQYGITVTAIHNHMLYESPRLSFLHFWAVDNPEKLAYGLRQALGQTNTSIG